MSNCPRRNAFQICPNWLPILRISSWYLGMAILIRLVRLLSARMKYAIRRIKTSQVKVEPIPDASEPMRLPSCERTGCTIPTTCDQSESSSSFERSNSKGPMTSGLLEIASKKTGRSVINPSINLIRFCTCSTIEIPPQVKRPMIMANKSKKIMVVIRRHGIFSFLLKNVANG